MRKEKAVPRSETEIRRVLLDCFYNRYKNSRSARSDRTGVAAKISVINRELKLSSQLSQQEIRRNLTYLISEEWIEVEQIVKHVPLPSRAIIPQSTSYYKITAKGVDKIEGPGEFTMPKFHGVSINANGQNIITLGDGNQVNARFSAIGQSLSDLRHAMVSSAKLSDDQKLSAVADIDAIQSQLAKPKPCASVIKTLWSGVEALATSAGLVVSVREVAKLLTAAYVAGG